MSTVRSFPARVVREDRAPSTVTALPDAPAATGADSPRDGTDPAAYDDAPAALYVYRQCLDGAAYTGVVCEVDIRAFVDGRVRGHEAVQPERVAALVRHQATTPERPGLVALLHHAGPAYSRTLDATTRTAPILDFPGPDGRHQTVWRVAAGAPTTSVTEELAAADHYVADGHHRVAAALEAWRQRGEPAGAGLLCVVHPMDGLRLSAFHRRVSGPVDRAELLALLTPEFRVRSTPGPPTPGHGTFGLYVDGCWFAVTHQGRRDGGAADLDVALLQTRVLDRLPRPGAADRVEVASARSSVEELAQRCDADGGAVFTLAPPPTALLTSLADTGAVMPPKTTYFEPKPCVGIFVRP